MKRTKVKGIIAAAIAATLLLGGVQSAQAKPMKPTQITSPRVVGAAAIDACLRKRADEGPARVTGKGRKDGRLASAGATFYNQFTNDRCRVVGETRIVMWVAMEDNRGRYSRNSRRVKLTIKDEGGKSRGSKYRLRAPYTCLPGPRVRGIQLVMKVTATYEGRSRTRTFRSGKIISPPSAAGYMLAGKVKC